MKICFLGDAASIHIRRWCEYFRDIGDEVSIISFRNAEIPGVKVYFIGEDLEVDSAGGNLAYLKKVMFIRKLVKNKIKPDIINAHYLTSYGFLATLIGVKPLAVSTWGSDILVTPNKNIIYKKLTEFVIKECNLLTSDSNFMTNEIKRLGNKGTDVITAPMGIDVEIFNSKSRTISDSNTFLSMRTLCDNSNIDYILRAFSLLLKVKPDSKLVLTNSGEGEKEVLGLINELELDKKVEFLGFINRDKVEELLKTSDVYLSIPTSDSTSVTLLEAMSCGAFPIVSDLPANREWIKSGENGLILNRYDEKELYELMLEAIKNKELRRSAMIKNRKTIDERAIWSENMKYVRDRYIALISEEAAYV